jgi:hypothetical protein
LTSSIFLARFQRLGDLEDLDNAVKNAETAVYLLPENHTLLPKPLITCAVSLQDRYQRLGNRDDLDKALEMCQNAIALKDPLDPALLCRNPA